jgi:hypothetical protein
MATSIHQIELTPEQFSLLSDLASRTGRSQQEVLSEALCSYEPVATNGGVSKTAKAESVYDVLHRKGLIGSIDDGPADLSTNPKYMEGFGESDY